MSDAGKSDAYRWGYDWAKLGMELHHWMLPRLGTTQWADAQIGFDDAKAALRSKQANAPDMEE